MAKTAIAITIALIMAGCTLMQMQAENAETEARIAQKEERLNELEAESERLEAQKARLAERLDKKRLTGQQLKKELDQLIRRNQKLAAMAKARGQDTADLKEEIEALEAKQAALSQAQASDDTEAIKKQRIQSLQEEIRNYLLLGLKSKHRSRLK